MIRDFKLFCKINNIKSSELQIFKQALDSFSPENTPCSFCSAKGALKKHGIYERYFIYLNGAQVLIETLEIPRYKCDCGHTHALLPAHIIPYSSYSLFFILAVLRAHFLSKKTVETLCDLYGIAISTLYAWIQLYNGHKAIWLGILSNLESSNTDFLNLLFEEENFLMAFFARMAFSFLQGMSRAATSRRLRMNVDP